ncbi:MAG: Alpha-acetolactate decarboxylase [Rhodobacteraceae bacterium HLUCCO07]|nr:MAG: Alpha-acetolactate decarboxylase [Rhodobacteraceae bacterium HLUCCO07]
MKHALPTLLILALPELATAQDLTAHGNFRHMMHSGDTSGTVALDTLDAPSAWGVGATAGMRGEIVLRDGEVLVSRGSDPEARLTPPEPGEEAAILARGTVADWHAVPLPHDMEPDRLTHFIEMQASARGLDTDAGFPIRLTGSFPTLVWHVVTGEPPHEGDTTHGGHGEGHANAHSAMNLYDEPGAEGEIVGVYTGPALEGVASHPGERLHLHFVSADGTRSGHVDEITFAAGTTLHLPDPAEGDARAMTTPADPREAGQSAFAAIQEIVAHLMADPDTDWASVDIEALRQHLVDMDNVTLRARVETQPVDGGARFVVTSDDPAVTASIRAMVPAHAATMDGVEGWHLSAEPAEGGAILTATGNDDAEPRIRGLGFIGLMTVGMHHQAHHLAIATGQAPHVHHDGHQHRAQD